MTGLHDFFELKGQFFVYSKKYAVYSISIERNKKIKYNKHNETNGGGTEKWVDSGISFSEDNDDMFNKKYS